MVAAARNSSMTAAPRRCGPATSRQRHVPFTGCSRAVFTMPSRPLPPEPPLSAPFRPFLQALSTQRWDDHRYYHHSRINQTLHFVSALSFIAAYALLFVDPASAALLAWGVSMTTRQAGHFFFEPRGYDHVNRATHEHKEEIKVGYNLRRKVVLLSVWAASPLALYADPTLFGLFEAHADKTGFVNNVAMLWLYLGLGGLLFRTVHLFFLQDVAAGLACDRGIIVDACARTTDPLIVAAGDCTARRLVDGTLLRLESVQNATEQAKSAAAALLGHNRPFTATPWFWSDQYDKKLQMAGLSGGADAWAVRGDLDSASFSVYHFQGGRLIAVDSINGAKDHLLARKLLEAGVSPAPSQASDPGFDLNTLLPMS
jgi:hypothetical protein